MSLPANQSRFARNLISEGAALAFFLGLNVLRALVLLNSGEGSLFQADYSLPPLLFWFLTRMSVRRWVTVALTFAITLTALIGDSIMLAGHQFRWGPDAVPQYLNGYRDLPWKAIVPIGLFVLITAVLSTAALTATAKRRMSVWPLICSLVALLAIDTQMGVSRFNDTSSGVNVLTSAFADIGPMYVESLFRGASLHRLRHRTMATDVAATAAPPQILSVAVESFGLALAPAQRASLVAPLIDRSQASYVIDERSHKFYGATLQGEIRELCGARLLGDASKPAVLRRLSACLPARLAAQGYDTEALHGNGGEIYDRLAVYPAMGFRKTWFYDALQANDAAVAPCSGTLFGGACDGRVYTRALSLFDGRKRFIHIMTLDSHLPVQVPAVTACPEQFASSAALCSYAALVRRSLSQLGAALAKSRFKPDLVYVYGDHPPPFSSSDLRKGFAADRVPFLILRKRTERAP